MLADELAELERWDPAMSSLLKSSHRFVLSHQFVTSALELAGSFTCAEAMTVRFRLPYPRTWVEWATNEGRAGILLSSEGFTLESDDLRQPIFAAQFAKVGGRLGFGVSGFFDPQSLSFEDEGILRTYCLRVIVPPGSPFTTDDLTTIGINAMTFVSLINAPKLTRQERVSPDRINAKRIRRGKRPLLDYHLVNLSDDICLSIRDQGEGERAGNRLHWRRGHSKARKSGIYWWNPHLAGRKDLGAVVKDYAA